MSIIKKGEMSVAEYLRRQDIRKNTTFRIYPDGSTAYVLQNGTEMKEHHFLLKYEVPHKLFIHQHRN